MQELRYPIGIQTFTKIREGQYLYIDKTEYIYRLVSKPGYYFLSRPRRFGKSLLLSTLECFFEGKRDYFSGLKIEEKDVEWSKHEVIHLDLNSKYYENENSIREIISFNLRQYEEKFGIIIRDSNIDERFFTLIKEAYRISGREVVVLIDEYDKPLLSAMDNNTLRDKYLAILKGFYSVLKSADRYLKFVMLTGVTRFGKVSVFSDLNNLRDISMLEEYEAICGITEQELHNSLNQGVKSFADARNITLEEAYSNLKHNYDGYHFSENVKDIYNPYSLMNALESKRISNYWFSTGTPTFLIKLLQKGHYDLSKLNGEIEYEPSQLIGVTVSASDAIPMLYQSGYLTIKRSDPFFKTVFLGYPNQEVEDSFVKGLLPFYSNLKKENSLGLVNDIVRFAMSGNADNMMTCFQSLLSKVPIHKNDASMIELHYHNMIYLIAHIVGLTVHTEYFTSNGRIDLVIETSSNVFIIEFKLNLPAADGIRQIDKKHYDLPFKAEGKKIFKIGASFSSETRTLSDWAIES